MNIKDQLFKIRRIACVGVLAIVVIIASAFSAILVYATGLLAGKVGMLAGLFFGFAFGMGGIGSAGLGKIVLMAKRKQRHSVRPFSYTPLNKTTSPIFTSGRCFYIITI